MISKIFNLQAAASTQAMRSCVTPMRGAATKEVTTIEGLEKNGLHPVQKAWMQITVPQCGYCQVGADHAAGGVLKNNTKPSDKEIDEAMSGNICRCGTYQRICAAIKAAAGEMA
jgi:isoquinoline 1-oxidoreductase subunit alpha